MAKQFTEMDLVNKKAQQLKKCRERAFKGRLLFLGEYLAAKLDLNTYVLPRDSQISEIVAEIREMTKNRKKNENKPESQTQPEKSSSPTSAEA